MTRCSIDRLRSAKMPTRYESRRTPSSLRRAVCSMICGPTSASRSSSRSSREASIDARLASGRRSLVGVLGAVFLDELLQVGVVLEPLQLLLGLLAQGALRVVLDQLLVVFAGRFDLAPDLVALGRVVQRLLVQQRDPAGLFEQ